ncbi:MAG: tripartite tricarboxylate transporter substrate binding protein [Betaproteobacteria bacterium]|nr:tripartite tricarboxylate transporter substrate binding protein [Betaproteobacteria bacterium]
MKIMKCIAAAALMGFALQVGAQNYPSRPVRVIIAFPPGSATDIIGRVITQKVTDLWGQNVVADNRSGAGGSIASAIAARAPADGHTLIINSGAHTAAPSMFAKLPYDTVKDFIDVLPLVAMPNVLAVNPSSRWKTFGEFLADAKANPRKINFAFAGLGSGTHLNTEKFKLAAKVDFTMVAYKGSGEVFPDLLAGRVDTYFTPLSAGKPYFDSGKLRPLAVTSAKRAAQLPNVPTIAEAGVPNFEFVLWFGLWGPQGIPAPVVAKIRKGFSDAMADPVVRDRLNTLGNTVMTMTPAEFSKFVRDEIALNARLFKAAGIKAQ